MQKQAAIIFPHQLFEKNPLLSVCDEFWLVEETLYFNQYHFHPQKLILHRASMQYYKDWLLNKKKNVLYVNAGEKNADCRNLIKHLQVKHYTGIHIINPTDNWLQKRIINSANSVSIIWHESPNFINTVAENNLFFQQKKKYFQTDYYIHQRKKLAILIDEEKNPIGGKWTFDTDNRAKFPKGERIPSYPFPSENKYVQEAKKYVTAHFKNPYQLAENNNAKNIFYPTTHAEAKAWFSRFLQERFKLFGIYEDAMVANESILYHSVLTPALNIGLLDIKELVEEAASFGIKNQVPLNSLEGFIRQLIGWREFIRAVYEREGVKQRTTNYWGFSRKIPTSFWMGTTGIVPVDDAIQKLRSTAYNHHIERLMLLGNFMLLCEFNPDEVYRWFMEMYIDAYDWVMVPNVYGMTQFADGGIMTTKPYISGSNYIRKMSNYPTGKWQEIWDALFWRFMHIHRSFFLKNPRLGMLIKSFDKMPADKQQKLLTQAENYLKQLDHD
ncbi:MAG: cryptochrome/photolyase family protein [Chitinophagaceae bacterium]|nr:cryptochrome/photolyase family protein [Chitinophagaceae bacterium]